MALTKLNIAVFAPMPSASVSTATAVKPGFLSNWRNSNFRSVIGPLSVVSHQSSVIRYQSRISHRVSFTPERLNRIDPGCAPGRQPASQGGDADQEDGDTKKCQWVSCAHPKELAADKRCQGERRCETDRNADQDEP